MHAYFSVLILQGSEKHIPEQEFLGKVFANSGMLRVPVFKAAPP